MLSKPKIGTKYKKEGRIIVDYLDNGEERRRNNWHWWYLPKKRRLHARHRHQSVWVHLSEKIYQYKYVAIISAVAILLGLCAVAAYFIATMEIGLRGANLAPKNSNGEPNEIETILANFMTFTTQLEMIVKHRNPARPVDYWTANGKGVMHLLFQDVHNLPHVGPPMFDRNWLISMEDFVSNTTNGFTPADNEYDFAINLIDGLFIKGNSSQDLLSDVTIDETGRILASRFRFQIVELVDFSKTVQLLKSLRQLSAKYDSYGLDVSFFTSSFESIEAMMVSYQGYLVVILLKF